MKSGEDPRGSQPELADAWRRFAAYDSNAARVQKQFVSLRTWVLVVGVLATALAIFDSWLLGSMARPSVIGWKYFVWLIAVLAPIVVAILHAMAARFARGADWVSLRGAAEAIKREIYRYRAGIGKYSSVSTRGEELTAAVLAINGRLIDTEVLGTRLAPYSGNVPPDHAVAEPDDGFSELAAEHYIAWRLDDQRAYFDSKSAALDRRHRQSQWGIAVLGGLGTLLAAMGQTIFVPISVACATALGSYLEMRNVETSLAGYNRAALELDNVTTWWHGLSSEAQSSSEVIAHLVDRTEAILGSENSSWVQGMQEAMAKLTQQDSEAG